MPCTISELATERERALYCVRYMAQEAGIGGPVATFRVEQREAGYVIDPKGLAGVATHDDLAAHCKTAPRTSAESSHVIRFLDDGLEKGARVAFIEVPEALKNLPRLHENGLRLAGDARLKMLVWWTPGKVLVITANDPSEGNVTTRTINLPRAAVSCL